MSDVISKVKAMISAPPCCPELKAAGQAYLDAIGTDKEEHERAALIKEIEEDVTPIDGLIEFAGSPHGAEVFGDKAAEILEKAKKVKAGGGKYCFCEACTNALAVLALLKK